MRTYSKLNKRGFTLVELMIVVAIIGVLAALAIYGVRRHLASAKTSEAKNSVGAISRGATAAFERESAASEDVSEGAESQGASHVLCLSAPPVPAAVPAGNKYQPSTTEGSDYETGSGLQGWRCVRFRMAQPHYYQYFYSNGASHIPGHTAPCTADCYEAAAVGDLDGDGMWSGFSRTGQVNTVTGKLKASTQLFVANEFE